MQKPRVLLADDHAIVTQGLEALLSPGFQLVGSVRDGHALVAAVEELRPDLVIMDISMPRLSGIEAIRIIKKSRVRTKLIVLSMHAEPGVIAQSLSAGANGYVLKSSGLERLEVGIQEVMAGRIYLCPAIPSESVLELARSGDPNLQKLARLTTRQMQVLQLIAEGRTMKEIAAILGISPRTAESHKYEMMSALGVKTTAELIRHAVRLKLVLN